MRNLLWYRIAAVIMIGNVLGFATWKLTLAIIQWMWMMTTSANSLLVQVAMIGFSFLLLTIPFLLVGIFGAHFVPRWQMFVGSACGLWVFTLTSSVYIPIPPTGWYNPVFPILLLGALGGWLVTPRGMRPPFSSRLIPPANRRNR